VVSVREYEILRDNIASSSGHRIVIGHFGATADVARGVVRAMRNASYEVALVESTDERAHARTANAFQADVYVAISLCDDEQETVMFYQSDTTISAGGYLLAAELQHHLSTAGTPVVATTGSRLPVLRETTMPAAICLLGLRLQENEVVPSIANAIDAWCRNPLARAE
jgi:N-acetylmuramoyl-L-alanine amidase